MATFESIPPSQSNPLSDPKMSPSKTKIVGYLLLFVALANTGVDALNGGGFDYKTHINDIYSAVGGLGLVFLRKAIDKVQALIGDLLQKVNQLSQK